MNCNETQFVMPLYLSSELDATRMADFEIHLQQCGACARELEYARHCDELLRDACLEEPVDTIGLRARVLSGISKFRPRRRFLPSLNRFIDVNPGFQKCADHADVAFANCE